LRIWESDESEDEQGQLEHEDEVKN
jgi:hypothetical protein